MTNDEIDEAQRKLATLLVWETGDYLDAVFCQAREANRLRELVRKLSDKIRSGMKFMIDEHCACGDEFIGMKLIQGKVELLLREVAAALGDRK